ncbi:MAG: PHP domain-containing protein [Oscillospiraceae bacterium]
MDLIDLHVHTTGSDGTLTPEETVALAAEKGLRAIAITDHDTAEAVPAALEAGKARGVEVVPGIEISVDYLGYGVHILGYFIDPQAPAMARLLDWVVAERKRRNHGMIERMRQDGIPITPRVLAERWPDAVIGRPHMAAFLVDCGLASSVQDAFDRYLSIGKKYFLKREYIPLEEAFRVIRESGGKAVFAHPFQYKLPEEGLLALTRTLKDAGAVGMECLYSGYTPEQTEYLLGLAADFGLAVTGGSDFHGSRKPHIALGSGTGSLRVPYELLEKLREA